MPVRAGHGSSAVSAYLDNVCHFQCLCSSHYLNVFDRVISAFDSSEAVAKSFAQNKSTVSLLHWIYMYISGSVQDCNNSNGSPLVYIRNNYGN